jgi:hypothetical protein
MRRSCMRRDDLYVADLADTTRAIPDVEGLHASLEDRIGLRRFSLRGLAAVTGEFLLAGLCHNLRLLYQIS